MIFVMLGGPATGKGTVSKLISKKNNIPHISTGSLLRDGEINKQVRDEISSGKLASDELVASLLNTRILEDDCVNGFVLDGFPRNRKQVDILNNMLSKLNLKVDKVLELVVDDKLACKRILERKQCEKCGKIYGIDFKSKDDITCDVCGGSLVIRSDDTEETLKTRIKIYKENSKEIIEYYKLQGILTTIDSSSPEKVLEMI